MNALTICQPYAHLIVTPQAELPYATPKRVENRTWPAPQKLIGKRLAIHAGKSRAWLEQDPRFPDRDSYGIRIADMAFGAVVGTADLLGCLHIDAIESGKVPKGCEWLDAHDHTEGPWCWVLANVVRFAVPIPAKGAQGPWEWTPTDGPVVAPVPSLFPVAK